MSMTPHLQFMHGSQLLIFVLIISSTQNALAHNPPLPPSGSATYGNQSTMATAGFIILGVAAFLFFGCVIPLCIIRNGSSTSNTTTTAITDGANNNDEGVARGKGRGVDQKVIETFPLINYAAVKHMRASKSPLECAICLSEFLDDDNLRLLPGCRHVFHVDCIGTWLAQRHSCPVCRSDLSDPKVIAGKRLLSLNIEPRDVANCSNMSEKVNVQKLKEPRHVQSMTGWERFTLILPEDVMKDIKNTQKYRKAISLQDYANRSDAEKSDWRIHSFMNALSWKRQQKVDSKDTSASEMSEVSNSMNISKRQLLPVTVRCEHDMLESDSSWTRIELNDLYADERV